MTPEEFFDAMTIDCKVTGELRSHEHPDVPTLKLEFESMTQFTIFMAGTPPLIALLRGAGAVSAGKFTMTVRCTCGMEPVEVLL